MRITFVLLITLLLGACQRDGHPAADAVQPVSPRAGIPETGIAAFFASGPVELGSTCTQLEARLGLPLSRRAVAVANRHNGSVTDSIITLEFAGVTAEIYRAGYDGKEMLSRLRITDDHFLHADAPIRLGATRDALLQAFGEPDEEHGSTLIYACEPCLLAGQESIVFVLASNALKEVDFRYWLD